MSDVVDYSNAKFPGTFKFPEGSYLADVFYTSGSESGGSANGGSALCMPKDVELVNLRLHEACIPEQVSYLPSFQ
jgi:hypothetical protein